MSRHPNAIAPDRQRRFDRAFQALAALCPGRERRLSDLKVAYVARIDQLAMERARWLIVAMSLARRTEGGRAIAVLARRGYVVSSEYGRSRQPAAMPLDTAGLLYLGHVLPSRHVPWKSLEHAASRTDPMLLPERRWCSAHETLLLQATLMAEGHDLAVSAHEAQIQDDKRHAVLR
jgi:hypothetical protein